MHMSEAMKPMTNSIKIMKLFHRSHESFNCSLPLTFWTQGEALNDDSFGSNVMEAEVSLKLASEEKVMEAVEELGLTSEEVEMPYEYLSPNLGVIDPVDCHALAERLIEKGFTGAKLKDFCCAESIITFNEVETA